MSSLTEYLTPSGGVVVIAVIVWIASTTIQSDVITAISRLIKSTGATRKHLYKNDAENEEVMKTLEAIIGETIPGGRLYTRAVIYLSGNLIISMAETAEQILRSSPEEKKSKTIVGLMLGEKARKSSKAQLFLILAIIISVAFEFLFKSPTSGIALIVAGGGLFTIQLDHKLIEYRVKNGWYGKNEFETREIIEFIISHANKDDFNDKGGLKKIIPTPEVVDQKQATSESGSATT